MLKSIWNRIVSTVQKVWNDGVVFVSKIWNGVLGTWHDFWTKAQTFVSMLMQKVHVATDKILDAAILHVVDPVRLFIGSICLALAADVVFLGKFGFIKFLKTQFTDLFGVVVDGVQKGGAGLVFVLLIGLVALAIVKNVKPK